MDAATAEVVRAFDRAGVDSILLKGPSIARWLYERPAQRTYVDCDLLVPPGARAGAEKVLLELGFEPSVEEREMPAWWLEHAVGWLRREDEAMVDLHRTLPGVQAEPEHLWHVLSTHVETIVVAGVPLRALTVPAMALHLALHAANHGMAGRYNLAELERALAQADEETWRAAADLAMAVDATAAFAAGLRLVSPGRELAARLALPTGRPLDVELRAAVAPPVALGLEQLARAGGVRERLAIVRWKLAPPRTFMRWWSPLARRGRAGMLLAYAWRPVWLLLHTPAGYRAWREARRRVR